METKHLARYNKVWRNKKNGKILDNELVLGKDESILDYEQIPKPKIKEQPKAASKKTDGGDK